MCKVKPGGFVCIYLLQQPKFVKMFLILELWKWLSALYKFNKFKYWNNCTFFRLLYSSRIAYCNIGSQIQNQMKYFKGHQYCHFLTFLITIRELYRMVVGLFWFVGMSSSSVFLFRMYIMFLWPRYLMLSTYAREGNWIGIVNLYLSKLGLGIKLYINNININSFFVFNVFPVFESLVKEFEGILDSGFNSIK